MNSPGNLKLTTNQLRSVKDVNLLPTSPKREDALNWTPKAKEFLKDLENKQPSTLGKPPKALKQRNPTLLPELTNTLAYDTPDKQSSKRGSLRQSVKDAASRILSQGYRTPSHKNK